MYRPDGVSNQARGEGAGSGSLTLDNVLEVDLTATDLTDGNFWVLVDDADVAVTYGPNFSVRTTALNPFVEGAPGEWSYTTASGAVLNFDESQGTLFVESIFTVPTASNGGLEIVACGFDANNNFTIELAGDATGVTVSESTDLAAGSFTPLGAADVTTAGNVITVSGAAIDADGDGRSFFQVTQ